MRSSPSTPQFYLLASVTHKQWGWEGVSRYPPGQTPPDSQGAPKGQRSVAPPPPSLSLGPVCQGVFSALQWPQKGRRSPWLEQSWDSTHQCLGSHLLPWANCCLEAVCVECFGLLFFLSLSSFSFFLSLSLSRKDIISLSPTLACSHSMRADAVNWSFL